MKLGVPVLVAALSFAFSIALAAPGLCWFDSGELALAAGTLGVSHAPGQPAYLVFAALAGLLPIGDLAFRLTVLSALSLAIGAGLLAAITSRLASDLLPDSPALGIAPLLAGGLLALSPAAVTQAVRPELYATSLALLLSAFAALLLVRGRGSALAVLAMCVAGAVHYALLVAVLPGLGVLALYRGLGVMRRGLGVALVLLLPGLMQYLWLPLRSMQGPILDFGHAQSLERILWVATSGPYRRSFELADGQLLSNAAAHFDLAFQNLGPLVLLLSLVGLGVVLRRSLVLAAVGLLVLGVGVLPSLLQGVFTSNNPDLWGYLLMPLSTVICAGSLGTVALVGAVKQRLPWLPTAVSGVVCLAVLVGPGLSSMQQADHSRRQAPARLATALLDGSPQGAVLALSGDSWLYPAMYQRYWEGRRADLQVLPLLQLDYPVLESLGSRSVLLSRPVLDGQEQRLQEIPARVRQEHYLRLLARSLRERPLMVNEAFVPRELDLSRQADGLLYRIDDPGAVAGLGALQTGARESQLAEDRLWTDVLAPLAASAGYESDKVAHGVLARRFVARAGFELSRGLSDKAAISLDRGSGLQPDHGAIIHLARYRLAMGLVRPASQEWLLQRSKSSWLDAFGRWDERAAEQLLDLELAAAEGELAQELRAVRSGARLLRGDLDGAQEDVREVLEEAPFHSGATLIRERLYSLGRQVRLSSQPSGPRPPVPATGGGRG